MKRANRYRSSRLFASAALLASFVVYAPAQSGSAAAQTGPNSHSIVPLMLYKTKYRLHAGEPVTIDAPSETLDFVRTARKRIASVDRGLGNGFVIGPSIKGDRVLLAASLTMEPGEYTVTISAVSENGERRDTNVSVTLDPLQTVPLTATAPPVVLLNGWQIGLSNAGCPLSMGSADTFGSLGPLLQQYDNVPVVYFFDNCAEDRNGAIEDLGATLGLVLGLIRYDNGTPVPTVDLVAHSMGGLIARSYLAGLQINGSFAAPSNPGVRKLVEIATPNFGSFVAPSFLHADFRNESRQPLLGEVGNIESAGDNLRGVDALAIVGNAAYFDGQPNASDGVVTLGSASLTLPGTLANIVSSRTATLVATC